MPARRRRCHRRVRSAPARRRPSRCATSRRCSRAATSVDENASANQQLGGPRTCCSPRGQGGRCPSSPSRSLPAAPTRSGDDDLGRDGRGAQLLGGLLAVAAVGDEQRVARRDEEHAGRAGEPGQVADVLELGDEQRITTRAGQRRLQPAEPRRDVEGGEKFGRGTRQRDAKRQDRVERSASPARRSSAAAASTASA